MFKISGVLLTEWHPVRVNKAISLRGHKLNWVFPNQIGIKTECFIDYWFDVVFENDSNL